MSCKSAIYTSNTTAQTVPIGGTIALGNTVRRFGNNLVLTNDAIVAKGAGYYKIDADFTITATNVGTVNIYLTKDGTAVSGAVASVSLGTAGDVVTIPITAIVREYGCCMDNKSNFAFVLSGTSESVTNASIVIEKV